MKSIYECVNEIMRHADKMIESNNREDQENIF